MSDDISPVHYGALVAGVASARVTGAAGGRGQGGGRKWRSGAAAACRYKDNVTHTAACSRSAAGMLHSGDTR